MAYDEKLAGRIRMALEDVPGVEEKKMFRGVTFMVNDKMCISVSAERLMCRIGAEKQQQAVERSGVSEVIMRGRVMKDFVYVSPEAFKSKKDFDFWIKLCLDFNGEAKSSKKKSLSKDEQ
ncbi:MAG TPA: TfoX/Sxy family protein [Chitinophagaceae bacterium]|nr:TfoX/Sxy family protein [Chitinophagaceae bacterium]